MPTCKTNHRRDFLSSLLELDIAIFISFCDAATRTGSFFWVSFPLISLDVNWRGRRDVKAHIIHLNHKERVRSISITNPVQTSSTRALCARRLDLVPTSFSPYVTTIIYLFFCLFYFFFYFNADIDLCSGRYGVYNDEKVT